MNPTKLLAVLFACASLIFSQGRGYPPGEVTSNLPAQKIGPRDLIAIQVYDSPELTRTLRISDDGFVRLPMVKQRIKAEGLMPNDLEALAQLLGDNTSTVRNYYAELNTLHVGRRFDAIIEAEFHKLGQSRRKH